MGHNDRISARIDSDLKESAVQIFQQLGITEGEAIRMFYSQVNLHQGMPFNVNIPNQKTIQAMKETEPPDELQTFDSFAGLRDKLGI